MNNRTDMTRLNSRLTQAVTFGVIGCWLLVSCAAIAGMYYLFWQRERIVYLGKEVDEQRVLVWKNSGLPLDLLNSVKEVDKNWPEYVNYSFSGQHDKKSYAEYLLVPRIPSSSETYKIDTDGHYEPDTAVGEFTNRDEVSGKAGLLGFVGSVLSVLGIALLLKTALRKHILSVPESFALACLTVFGSGLFSKVIFQSPNLGFYLVSGLGVSGIIVQFFQFVKNINTGKKPVIQNIESGNVARIITIVLLSLVFCSLVWSFLMAAFVVPDDWDAWAIWGVKAKLLLLGKGPIADITYVGHADYPLLWPFIWAYSAWCGGGWEESWSRGWGSVFYLFVLWEIAIIVYRKTKDIRMAFFSMALFATIPMVPVVVSWSYAEAPFWLFTITCMGCLFSWSDADEAESLGNIIVAALLAAGAAYTKNEGILFALIALTWLIVNSGRNRPSSVFLYALIFVVSYLPWVVWVKVVMQLGSHATEGLSLSGIDINRVWQRVPKAFECIITMWSDIKQWGSSFYLAAAGLFFVIICGPRRANLLIPLLMLAGYFVVIVFHQADIYWQVGTSWNRLTLQVMPLFLVAVFSQLSQEKE